MATRSQELQARRAAAVARGVATACEIFPSRALNAEVWDVEGRRYIDFAGGIAVQNTGHCHPRVMAAAEEQMRRFVHTAFQVIAYEPYIRLAERLNALAPIRGPVKSIFFSTGAEAVENAVKLARAYTGRAGVIAFTGAFHGRTFFTLGMTGKVTPYKEGFGPFPGDVYHAPFPTALHGVTTGGALEALDGIFRADIEPRRVAAMVIEPVQGEGGFYIAPFDFLRGLRALCDQHGIVLVVDEIQSGFGRTGKTFAIEHAGVEPDLITVAKSLAAGFPLSGVIGKQPIVDAPAPGGLGGTYGGNPVACAAALAVLDVLEEERLNERSMALGSRIAGRLEKIARRDDVPPVAEVRHLGGMVALELSRERGGRAPDAAAAKAVKARALANGLILLGCGVHANVLRILVPLTASDEVVDEGLEILERSMVESQRPPSPG